MDKLLLKVEEAAKALSIGKSQAYELVAQGVIPSVRLGPRCIRVPKQALENWAAGAANDLADKQS